MWRIKEGGLLFVPGDASRSYSTAKTEVGETGGYFGHRGDEADIFYVPDSDIGASWGLLLWIRALIRTHPERAANQSIFDWLRNFTGFWQKLNFMPKKGWNASENNKFVQICFLRSVSWSLPPEGGQEGNQIFFCIGKFDDDKPVNSRYLIHESMSVFNGASENLAGFSGCAYALFGILCRFCWALARIQSEMLPLNRNGLIPQPPTQFFFIYI